MRAWLGLLGLVVLLASVSFADPSIEFVSPTPTAGTNHTTYGMVFNFSSNESLEATGNYIEIDGVNNSCSVADDNLSCSYTLVYADHKYNNTYDLIAWGNVSDEYYSDTRQFDYYGCGVVTADSPTANNATAGRIISSFGNSTKWIVSGFTADNNTAADYYRVENGTVSLNLTWSGSGIATIQYNLSE
jgi:hypothetical protein